MIDQPSADANPVPVRRRRALGLSIGWFTGLVLSGAWAHKEVFWWPAFGADFGNVALLPALGWIIVSKVLVPPSARAASVALNSCLGIAYL